VSAINYSDNCPATTLSATINASVTSFAVASLTGFPATPFRAVIDINTASAEVVEVTAHTGTTLTVTRNRDGQGALSHNAGATFTHAMVAQDLVDAQTHINATAAHGATGAVVGTTNTQTLSNKTLTSPTVNNPTVASPTVTGDLTLSSGSVLGGLRVQASCVKNTNGIATATELDGTIATWTEEIDTLGAFVPATGLTTIPAGKGGKYRISGRVCLLHTNVDATMSGYIYKSGAQLVRQSFDILGNGNTSRFTAFNFPPRIYTLAVGDTIRLGADAGSASTFLTTDPIAASYILIEQVA
jgi:hypothetical protein